MAQPLRKIRQRIAPAVPKGGFSFTLPPLAAGDVYKRQGQGRQQAFVQLLRHTGGRLAADVGAAGRQGRPGQTGKLRRQRMGRQAHGSLALGVHQLRRQGPTAFQRRQPGGQHHGQRAGPKGRQQRFGGLLQRHIGEQQVKAARQQGQRHVDGPALGLIHSRHGHGLVGTAAQAVERLCGKGQHAAITQLSLIHI